MRMPSPDPQPASPSPPPNSPRPTPDFAAQEQANRLLTNANIALRRGQTAEADRAVQEALVLRPEDAAAQEMLADVRLARFDTDGAITALRAALALEPKRPTAEAKLARLILQQSEGHRRETLGVAYAGQDVALMRAGDADSQRRSASLAVTASLFLPGLGQFVLGQWIKGGILIGIFLISLLVLGQFQETQNLMLFFVPSRHGHTQSGGSSGLVWLFALILAADWLYALGDVIAATRKTQD